MSRTVPYKARRPSESSKQTTRKRDLSMKRKTQSHHARKRSWKRGRIRKPINAIRKTATQRKAVLPPSRDMDSPSSSANHEAASVHPNHTSSTPSIPSTSSKLELVPASKLDEAEQAKAYKKGFMRGKYEGGEALLSKLIPEHMILPDISLEQIIAYGFEHIEHLLLPLADPAAVYAGMKRAMEEGRPMSVVRLGDGELLALAHDRILSSEEIRDHSPFVATSGMSVPDHAYRDALAESVRHATYVGVPISRLPYFQGLLYPVFRMYELPLQHMQITYSTVNYLLAQYGYLYQLLQGKQVLLVGNAAKPLADVLTSRGITISGIVSSVSGMHDIPRVMEKVAGYTFDIALVSAGIPAVIIAERIASQLGKVALDFGHLANKLAEGEMNF